MKQNIKRTFATILVAATITTSFTTPAMAKAITVNMPHSIYETKESNHLSSGVVHETIRKFTTAGWWNINVLRVDLSDPHTDIKGLINPSGISSRDKVSSMVEKSKAVAGINGDYFSYSPLPHSIGTLINDGEIISSPIELAPYAAPSFFLDILNQAEIGYLDRTMVATNERTGQKVSIYTLNRISDTFENITMINKHWGAKSIGNRFHKDLVEVVVENNTVVDVRVGREAVNIPKDGYVLSVRGAKSGELTGFSVGDTVDLHMSTTPGLDNIKFAIGGGSIILKNGELSLTNIHSQGNQPRTGIGISEDGSELILVTIDGRDTSFKGVGQEMFGAILRDLGAFNALNLDGGGSTTMAIMPIDEKKSTVVNKPSEGSERSVVNGIGVFSNAPVGELSYLKVSTDDSNMFINTTRAFSVKGFDKYHNPVAIDESKLSFTQSGVEGSVTGNKFNATSQGKATITAYHGESSGSVTVNVLGTVADLSTDLANFNIDINSERKLPIFSGKDENGYQAKVYPEDITFTTTNDIGTVIDGTFHSSDVSVAGALTATLGKGVANTLVSVGSNGTLLEGFENANNIQFAAFPDTVTGSVSLSNHSKEGANSASIKYDFSQGDGTRAAYLNFMKEGKIGLPLPGAPRKLGLWVNGDNSGSWLRGTIKDKKGDTHTIDFAKSVEWEGWKYVTTDIPTNISYPLVLERIYVVESNDLKKQAGEILVDGLVALYPPAVGSIVLPTPSTLKDSKNVSSKVIGEGYSFGVVAEPKGLNDIVKYDASSKIKARINQHKIGVLLGGASPEFNQGLTNYSNIDASSAYSKNAHHDMAFINVNTSKNGIRATDASQWTKLKSDLENIATNNITVFLSTPIFGAGGFTDILEADLLHKYLVEASERGKNIFVVHGGSTSKTDLKDGIRYISLNTKPVSKPEDIYDLSIVEFVVNGSDVTYQISPLFERAKVKVN